MITDRLDGATITGGSTYDSGRHTGFTLTLSPDGYWSEEGANTFLTEEQIKTIEAVIVSLAKNFVISSRG